MARYRHLKNAPIREALVDIAIKAPEGVDSDVFKSLRDSVSPEYPNCAELFQAEFEFQFSEEQAKTARKTPYGFACRNADGTKIVQFRPNGFTYNWLKPYSSWEELRQRAQACWNLYASRVEPISVTRIALRYINNLTLPIPLRDFDEYLAAQPNIPKTLPQGLAHFLTRVAIVDESGELGAVVTQVFDGIIKSNQITVILDIDASRNLELLPTEGERIWAICDQLRDFKNRIFFESLTEKAVEAYE